MTAWRRAQTFSRLPTRWGLRFSVQVPSKQPNSKPSAPNEICRRRQQQSLFFCEAVPAGQHERAAQLAAAGREDLWSNSTVELCGSVFWAIVGTARSGGRVLLVHFLDGVMLCYRFHCVCL